MTLRDFPRSRSVSWRWLASIVSFTIVAGCGNQAELPAVKPSVSTETGLLSFRKQKRLWLLNDFKTSGTPNYSAGNLTGTWINPRDSPADLIRMVHISQNATGKGDYEIAFHFSSLSDIKFKPRSGPSSEHPDAPLVRIHGMASENEIVVVQHSTLAPQDVSPINVSLKRRTYSLQIDPSQKSRLIIKLAEVDDIGDQSSVQTLIRRPETAGDLIGLDLNEVLALLREPLIQRHRKPEKSDRDSSQPLAGSALPVIRLSPDAKHLPPEQVAHLRLLNSHQCGASVVGLFSANPRAAAADPKADPLNQLHEFHDLSEIDKTIPIEKLGDKFLSNLVLSVDRYVLMPNLNELQEEGYRHYLIERAGLRSNSQDPFSRSVSAPGGTHLYPGANVISYKETAMDFGPK